MNYSMHYFVVVDTTQDILYLKYIYIYNPLSISLPPQAK